MVQKVGADNLPFGLAKAQALVRIAEELEEDQRIAKLVEAKSWGDLYEVVTTTGDADVLIDQMLSGENITRAQVKDVKALPTVQLLT